MKPKPEPVRTLPTFWYFLIYLSLSGILTLSHRHWIDEPFQEKRLETHEQVIHHQAPAPIQYRIMIPYMAEGLRKTGVSFLESFVLIRFLFTALAGILFHLFLRRWYSPLAAFSAVLYFYACLPLTHLHYYMQPMDMPNLVFFILALMLIRDGREGLLALLSGIAMLNRETFVLVPLLWLLCRWDELPLGKTILFFLGHLAVVLGVYFGLRVYFGNMPYYSEAYFLQFNLKSPMAHLYFLLMFGVIGVLGVRQWKECPKFLRRAALFSPFFVVFHLMLTIFQEPRLMLPLFPILIPLALAAFAPPSADAETPRLAPAGLVRFSKVLYVLGFVGFIGLTNLYAQYLERVHVAPWREKVRNADMAVKAGYAAYQSGNFQEAERLWLKGLESNHESFDLHYNLGGLYAAQLHDRISALAHWRACLEIAPGNPKAQALKSEMERLEKTP